MTPEEHAYAAAIGVVKQPPSQRRKLSWIRVLAIVLAVAAVLAGVVGFRQGTRHASVAAPVSSFSPYVDVTATPQFAFEDLPQSSSTNVVLGFVVSAPAAACQPSWGGAYSLDTAASGMDLDRRIARLRQRGGQVSVSFGGEANSELSVGCTDATGLEAAYRSVVERYSASTIDLDIEGAAASTPEVNARRATAIAALQAAEQSAGRSLSVWLTLPVSTSGLTDAGRAVLDSLLGAQVSLAGVNALTMDYGQTLPAGATMATMAESALSGLQQQVSAAYSAAGTPIDAAAAWQHVGATPMIGQNDTTAERFELSDARELLGFAQSHHVARLSMWSLNRDQGCGPNYANVEIVSDACSGVSQSAAAFTNTFARFSTPSGTSVVASGASSTASSRSTPSSSSPPTAADDPATSPYQIWNPSQAYPKNTKIVWHHNVYESKWYTQGDTPDAPVAAPTDTPWTLIGPVLPGEHPAPIPTLAAGTYPAWTPAQIYVGGDRVLYEGVGYQAKWWTQGDLPGTSVQTPSDTPWQVLAAS